MNYPVNEIFYSVQGEGNNSGVPFVFVRFAGCNIKCYFCDTEHDMKYMLTLEQIVNEIKRHDCKSVVLTGGEPTIHDIEPLIERLVADGYFVAIETNGYRDITTEAYICCSPKIKNKYRITKNANEVKYIIDSDFNEKNIDFSNKSYSILLQPEWNDRASIDRAIEIVKRRKNCRLSLQIQKYANFR
jgi:7-carboxy-7-deazaguanine synthase